MKHIPQSIAANPRYTKILQDKQVDSTLQKAYIGYCKEQDYYNNFNPFMQEELALNQRKNIESCDDIESQQDLQAQDLQAFESFNATHKAMLDSMLHQQTDTESARKYALAYWDNLLRDKKQKWLESMRKRLKEQYIQALKDFLDHLLSILETLLRVYGLCGIKKPNNDLALAQILNEAKQSFDMKQLCPNTYEESDTETNGYDYSKGHKRFINFKEINAFIKHIQTSKDLRKIAALLGREEKNGNKKIEHSSIDQSIKTHNHKEEMSGVTLGRDLANLLPQELAMLKDENLELLFNLKYIQNRLFCFEKQGYETIQKEHYKMAKNEGAMIICVDTSSSMSGNREYLAKAITLFLATKASMQNRACYLINFSTDIETMELSGKDNARNLINFLAMSFNGGTDVAPALKEGLKKMQEDSFKQSDLIVISDGYFGEISQNLQQQMQDQRHKGNKFYLLDIDDNADKKTFFDTHWVYDTQTQKAQVLYAMK